jgi:hypothetical protein
MMENYRDSLGAILRLKGEHLVSGDERSRNEAEPRTAKTGILYNENRGGQEKFSKSGGSFTVLWSSCIVVSQWHMVSNRLILWRTAPEGKS